MSSYVSLGGSINQVPSQDGEVNTFVYWRETAAPADKPPQWFDPTKRVFFVNGMMNSGADHARSALNLSRLNQCPVIGVYNKSGGFFRDLSQCITDKWQFDGPRLVPGRTVSQRFEEFHQAYSARRPGTTRDQSMDYLLNDNPAAAATLGVVRTLAKSVPLFAHSQGNLILSNALSALKILDGPEAIRGRSVQTYGSPARNWPKEVTLREHGFTYDPVTWLTLRFSFDISKVGVPETGIDAILTQPVSHSFDTYLKSDPEFVINFFRWGGLRMTFSMDEEGLAQALVDMRRNVPRVIGVFERLHSAHESDVDDVAVEYVRRLRDDKDPTLAGSVLASDPLRKLLIKALDEGFTGPAERVQLEYLREFDGDSK